MAVKPQQPLFLARSTYRQRRWRDAAKILPVASALAMVFPLLWHRGSGLDPARTSSAFVYLFCVWIVVIVAAMILSRRIKLDAAELPPSDGDA